MSTEFYAKLLDKQPILNVPGMTEFSLSENSILGLMPIKSIETLLENRIEAASKNDNKVKAELYLVTDAIDKYLERAKLLKAEILSYTKKRDWGHKAAYLLDPDNNVIGIAETIKQQSS
jgi:hypothetical protein